MVKGFFKNLFPFSYHENGILGINARNRDFILPYNKRKHYPLADDKVATKKIATEAGIQVPELYGVIEFQKQAYDFKSIIGDKKSFVIKPAQGSGGGGVLVIKDVDDIGYHKTSGHVMSESEVRFHIQNILSGLYSLGDRSDKAIIEYAVEFDPIFNEITYQGVPDVRVLVFKGFPVMAMLRLPTKASDGKANLHSGGIGVGIDMRTGLTLSGLQKANFIDAHPETRKDLGGRQIPYWETILEMSAKFYEMSGLGYLGVDIVLDKNKGPMMLEINARPGIAIQISNREGLLNRLKIIENVKDVPTDIKERVRYSMETFGVK
jgi:alpha-L-glutamate ligase-like protein